MAALQRHAPQEAASFESELREALARAGTDLDVARVDQVMARWHTRACVLVNALTDEEQALLRRARAGDFTRLRVCDENGGWTTLYVGVPPPQYRLLWLEIAERQYLGLPDDTRARSSMSA